MKVILTKGYKDIKNELVTLFSKNDIIIYGDGDVQSLSLSNGGQLFTVGNIIGIRESKDSMRKINKNNISSFFKSGFSVKRVNDLEGRFFMIYCNPDGTIKLLTDRYGQFDIYYSSDGDKVVFASDL